MSTATLTQPKIAGRWNYSDSVSAPHQYGDEESYRRAAAWLNRCGKVEDRGCGCAYAKKFFSTKYVGLDGSPSRWTDLVVDLMAYRNSVPGIQMRHVLEHNPEWRTLLRNALEDFTERMALVLHIGLSPADTCLNPATYPNGVEIPNISLSEPDLMALISPFIDHTETLRNGEIIYYLAK